MKKFICLFLSVLFAISCFAMLSACGENNSSNNGDGNANIDSGSTNDNQETPDSLVEATINGVTYTPNQNNTYSVTAVELSSTTLTIEQSVNGVNVTEIGKDAVRGKSNLLKVVLPETIKTIDESAFLGCKKLKEIDLSKVEYIGKNAFNGAITTTNTNLNLSSLKEMGDSAFAGATKLREVDMESATLVEIPEKAFFGCTVLYTVKLPESVKIIRKQAFMANGCLVNINLENVERFKDCCFSECVNLVSLTLTNAIEIRHEAFFQCTKLSTVTVGDKIEVFYFRAFYSDYSLTYFKMGNLNQPWWWYHVSANAFTSDEINKDFWVGVDEAGKQAIYDPIEFAKFLQVNRNVGTFICAESWVMARGYKDSQNFPHRTHFLED